MDGLTRLWRSLYPWLKVVVLIGLLVVLLRYEAGEKQGGDRLAAMGKARVVDGDSIVVDSLMIRLRGIDAPEGQQVCRGDKGPWLCGQEATRQLRRLIGDRTVSCRGTEYDQHGRLLGLCTVGETELNRWLVENGWAVSYGSYIREANEARYAKKGIWSSQFQNPSNWRKENLPR